MSKLGLFFLLIIIFSFASCVGGKGMIKLEKSKYPLSLSPSIYGAGGKVQSLKNGLVFKKRFFIKKTFWGLAWSNLSLSDDAYITEMLNKKIKEANGDGAVNITVLVQECTTSEVFALTVYLPILPVIPGCSKLYLQGDIVKFAKTGGSK